jgi:hypothetical protein
MISMDGWGRPTFCTYEELTDEAKARAYPPLTGFKHKQAVEQARRSQNSRSKSFAADIAAGRIYNADGSTGGYWYVLATQPPDEPPYRRGQWKATTCGNWYWQDWGERPLTLDELPADIRATVNMPLTGPFKQAVLDRLARSMNDCREFIAEDIEVGRLYGISGNATDYWRCKATRQPARPAGRRGRWKASLKGVWEWQDQGVLK